MKKLELNQLGVQELSISEMSKIEGGGPVNDLLTNLLGAVGTILTDTGDFLGKTVNTVVKLLWSL